MVRTLATFPVIGGGFIANTATASEFRHSVDSRPEYYASMPHRSGEKGEDVCKFDNPTEAIKQAAIWAGWSL